MASGCCGLRSIIAVLWEFKPHGLAVIATTFPPSGPSERCGGVRMEEKKYLDGKPMDLYEIPLKEQEKEEGVS